ncbi:MAG: LD-carboxypeptidase [Candidatus Kapaibacteriales bacterium]
MDKRTFIKSSFAAAATVGFASTGLSAQKTEADTKKRNTERSVVKPQKLELGDSILLISPGTHVSDPLLIKKAIENIESLGYRAEVSYDPNMKYQGYNTRSRDERAEELIRGFEDDRFQGVWCIRGGYGTMDILNLLDYDIIRKNPKPFFGYSDITALHQAFFNKTGLITFHSPVALSNIEGFTRDSLSKLLNDGSEGLTLETVPEGKSVYNFALGDSRGRLVGGNLSLVSALCGTEYLCPTEGCNVFLEDVGERPYRLHRMLKQLELAGYFESARSLLMGVCDDCDKGSGHTSDMTEAQVYQEIFSRFSCPASIEAYIGHTKDQATLPHGALVSFDSKTGSYTLMEDVYS